MRNTGCQRPMITAASAMKPLPTVNSVVKEPVEARVKKEPPRPPKTLARQHR